MNLHKHCLRCLCLFMMAMVFCFTLVAHEKAFAADGITITLDGKVLTFPKPGVSTRNERVIAPILALCEAMGAHTEWNADTQEIMVYLYNRYVWLQASNDTLYFGTYSVTRQGEVALTSLTPQALGVKPSLSSNRLIAPIGPVVNALGGTIQWDAETSTAHIKPPDFVPVTILPDTKVTNRPISLPKTQHVFQPISATDAADKYAQDEPFVLLCYDSSLTSPAYASILSAAEALSIKIYGLDWGIVGNKKTGLPFVTVQAGEEIHPMLYLIKGLDNVESLTAPAYQEAYSALLAYWETE